MPEEKLIPARHADIFWNVEPNNGLAGGSAVLILDRRETVGKAIGHGDPDHLLSSTGAMVQGWLTSGHPLDNPAGVFAGNWLAFGSSHASMEAALREFAKIEEASWAREMVAALDWIRQRQSED